MSKKILCAITGCAAFWLSSIAPALPHSPAAPAVVTAMAGSPDTAVANDLYAAGGGPGSFSIIRALESMIGPSALQTELTGLDAVYGQSAVDRFTHVFDYVAADGWMRLGDDNVAMPGPVN
jgi:hypothetical protein